MRKILILLILLIPISAFGMGYFEKPEEPEEPPKPPELVLQAHEYIVEVSSSLSPGNIAGSFSPQFIGKIASVSLDGKPLRYGTTHGNQWETWVGGKPGTYNYPAELRMTTKSNRIYVAQVLNQPGYVGPPPVDPGNPGDPEEPETPPVYGGSKDYHHWNPLSWHGKGSSLILCHYSPEFSSCKLKTGNKIRKMDKHGGKDPDILGRPRTVWTIYNTPRLSGQVICKKGSKEYKFSVPESRKQLKGKCYKKR